MQILDWIVGGIVGLLLGTALVLLMILGEELGVASREQREREKRGGN